MAFRRASGRRLQASGFHGGLSTVLGLGVIGFAVSSRLWGLGSFREGVWSCFVAVRQQCSCKAQGWTNSPCSGSPVFEPRVSRPSEL